MMHMDSDCYNAAALVQLIELGLQAEHEWTTDDLKDILEHLLGTNVPAEALPDSIKSLSLPSEHDRGGNRSISFRTVLISPHASIDVLRSVKDYFKRMCYGSNESLPLKVSTAMYYGVLSAAWVHHGVWISSVDPHSMQDSFSWILKQPWVDSDLHALIAAALEKMAGA